MLRFSTSFLVLGVMIVVTASPAAAYPRPGLTERVSVTADGQEITAGATSPSISDDGRYVAFVTQANGVVPGDQNNAYDVYVRDRLLGRTERVSVGSDGQGANGLSLSPSVTGDGRYVLFTTGAAFDPRDTNKTWDPYIRDLAAGTTTLAVVSPEGASVPWGIGDPHMSDDASVVVFATGFNLLPEDANGTFDVYAYHRDTATVELVSVTPAGASGNGESYWNNVSGNGRYAVYYSFASNLVANDTNGATDVFVRDLVARKTIRVSTGSDGTEGNASSILPDISDDGRYVAFVSYASNLVPADANPINDVFVHDLVTRRTERVSVASDGTEPNLGISSSWEPSISSDGRYVAFASSANNLVDGDTNGIGDFFVHDRATGATERVSVASDGSQMSSNNSSAAPAVTAGGRHVAFTANAPNLVPGDANAVYDVFVRDRGPEVGVGHLVATRSGAEIRVSGWVTYSGDSIAAASDDDRDGRPPAPGVSAAAVGGELIGARLAYRPEPGDLLARWEVTRLPGARGPASGVDLGSIVSGGLVPSVAGIPGVVYGLDLTVGGARFEVRSLRLGATAVPAAGPLFALYRCQASCEEVRRLRGSFGTTGEELRAVIPLDAIDAIEGATLGGLRAFAGVGEAGPGSLLFIDEVGLGSVDLPSRSVEIAVAPSGTPEQELAYVPASSTEGGFEVIGEADGPVDVWARACMADRCGGATLTLP